MERSTIRSRLDPDAYAELQPSFRQSLSGPQDDMWASFADAGTHHALIVDERVAGFASINEDRELLSFFVQDDFEETESRLFQHVMRELGVVTATPSTVDPSFLSLSLEAGKGTSVAAILFRHVREPTASPLSSLRVASEADLEPAIAFAERAMGAPRAFLKAYFGERISLRELYIYDEPGSIMATGECRVDRRCSGFAHLGIIVDPDQRKQGLGTRAMHQLVLESRAKDLEPVCSTESQNFAARSVIRKTGFAPRHRVFRVTLGDDPVPTEAP